MKISVPFDFSKESVHALNFGEQMSQRLGMDLKLVHCLGFSDFPYYNTEEAEQVKAVVAKNAQSELEKIFADVLTDPDKVAVEIVNGRPAPEIIKTSYERKVQFTVLGRKQSRIPEKVGSTARDIMRYASGSVLSINRELSLENINNILLVTDFEPTPVTAIENIKTIQKLNNATLNILYVNTRDNWKSTKETQRKMRDFCELHKLTNTELCIENDESLEKGVLHYLEVHPVDMIAIKITRSFGKLDVVDSHLSAERIMDHSDLPILTYSKNPYKL